MPVIHKNRQTIFRGEPILALLPEELERELAALGGRRYRAQQIFQWLHQKQAARFEDMTDLPGPLRRELAASYAITAWLVTVTSRAKDGSIKWLLRAADGGEGETVLMRAGNRRTQSISTQE